MATIARDENIRIVRQALGPYETNSYLLICERTGTSVIVDAPGEAEKVLAQLAGTTPKMILMTHNHMDHVGALAELKKRLKVPVAVHPGDAGRLPTPADRLLSDGESICFGNARLAVIHTPGHTPGSICFLTDKYLISGDTLFPGGPGKTMSPEAFQQIMTSITSKLLHLPLETRIYPGHGEPTTLEQERAAILAFSARKHPEGVCGDVLWESS